jgi:ribulose-bisphosphate carboxylase large chain
VASNIRSLLAPLGQTIAPLPVLSSGQNVTTPGPTFEAVGSTDLMMLAGGGVAAHPDGPGAGVQSLRQAWEAAVDGVPLQSAADTLAHTGDEALLHAVQTFAKGA